MLLPIYRIFQAPKATPARAKIITQYSDLLNNRWYQRPQQRRAAEDFVLLASKLLQDKP